MRSNPFATRFTSPGQIPWFEHSDFPGAPEQHRPPSLDYLVCRWREECGFQAAIVGPHGSGKSTLLWHLGALLHQQVETEAPPHDFRQLSHARTVHIQLKPGNRPLRQWCSFRKLWQPGVILLVDGLEQLPVWYRIWFAADIRYHQICLLATSHRKMSWLPTLCETEVSTDLAATILRYLVEEVRPEWAAELCNQHRLQELLARHRGNLREVLMELYDDYERLKDERTRTTDLRAAG